MPHGDILGFAPPLVVTESEIDEIVDPAYQATRQIMDELAKEGATK
jgi:L-2,4-diaminobutyrate transaminase